jgi:hypothetical protein
MAADHSTERRRRSGNRARTRDDPIIAPDRLIADHV